MPYRSPRAGRASAGDRRVRRAAPTRPALRPRPAGGGRAARARPNGPSAVRHRAARRAAAAAAADRAASARAWRRPALGAPAAASAQGARAAADARAMRAGRQRGHGDRPGVSRLDRERSRRRATQACRAGPRRSRARSSGSTQEHLHRRAQDSGRGAGAAADPGRQHRPEPGVQSSDGSAGRPAVRGAAGREPRRVQGDDPRDAAAEGAGARVRAEPAHRAAAGRHRDA